MNLVDTGIDSYFNTRYWLLDKTDPVECCVCHKKVQSDRMTTFSSGETTSLFLENKAENGYHKYVWHMGPDLNLCCSVRCFEFYYLVGNIE